jgi:hypothetical protein
MEQNKLAEHQLEAFYHDLFVEDQARDFVALLGGNPSCGEIVDMGGGCGFFAHQLKSQSECNVKVIDMDVTSVKACHELGVEAIQGDALSPEITGREGVVCFNLILHHLVGESETKTLAMQTGALSVWKRPHVKYIFVNEYIYESWFSDISGRLIFQITKSPILSWVGRMVAVVVPSLKANTFGVGVRFRSNAEWIRVFSRAGFRVKASLQGQDEEVSLPRRMLLIKAIRRNSYLLEPSQAIN